MHHNSLPKGEQLYYIRNVFCDSTVHNSKNLTRCWSLLQLSADGSKHSISADETMQYSQLLTTQKVECL